VTVVAPETAAPGHDSPGAAVIGFFDAINAKKYAAVCSYVPPGVQSSCRKQLLTADGSGLLTAFMPTAKNLRPGYVAIHGTKSLVGTTGELCWPAGQPTCVSNNNPAAILNSGKPFSAVWKATFASASSSGVYTLYPCLKVGGKWYTDIFSS
jgi:hypothetical protein